ncbi:MAG TPA: glycogen synthase GlgA [Vicinamibacterales bacterium]|nr:glycogen synthase GlgA [Vicinamibacterales bacterium]
MPGRTTATHPPPLDVTMVVPEARPFAQTGGLADVAGALPQALARLGHRVTVVMPHYRGIDIRPEDRRESARLPLGEGQGVVFVERPLGPGVRIVFVDAPELFDRPALYGVGNDDYPDNWLRFAVLSLGAIEHARKEGRRPSVFHAHDWQAGLVAAYLKTRFADDPLVGGVPSVLTIHNLAFQGLFPPFVLPAIGLRWDLFRVDLLEYWGQVSYLKAGVNFSRMITTVSPTYAKEVLTPELGFGFDGILANRAADLVGILNGIDTDVWNPEDDQYLPEPFSAGALAGKAAAKRELLRAAGLPAGDDEMARPVIGMVSRLTDQKGFDLVQQAAGGLMGLDASWVVLGSGEPRYERFWTALAGLHRQRVAVRIGFDERLSHLIEGGADLFLMPSRFEPCGLNQMYSLRYGTVPVVRATGGLDDTVIDADASPASGTGFTFKPYTPDALLDAVERALRAWGDPRRRLGIQRRGMRQDHAWDVSAREYVKVYRMAAGTLPAARRSGGTAGASRPRAIGRTRR